MRKVKTGIMLAVMTVSAASAQERMNVVLKEGTVQNFNIPEIEQVVFDSKGAVSLLTGNAKSITATCATISAKLITDESCQSGITYGFFFGTSSSAWQKVQADGIDEEGFFSVNLSDLAPGTTYYYQPYAIVNGVTYKGASSFFRTKEEQADNFSSTSSIAFPINGKTFAFCESK